MSERAASSDDVAPAPEVDDLKVVCAWCKKVLRTAAPGAKTSHGICETCRKSLGPIEVNAEGQVEFLA